MSAEFYFIVIPLVILILYIITVYNSLVSYSNKAKNAFATIDVMLKKRYDLIPNMVKVVQGYMNYEKELLESLTIKRSKAKSNQTNEDEEVALNNEITGCMKSLMVQVENHPDLKANETFLKLQKKLAYVEANLSAARRSFNMHVTLYNNKVDSFPSKIIASTFKFKNKSVLEACESSRNFKVENQ